MIGGKKSMKNSKTQTLSFKDGMLYMEKNCHQTIFLFEWYDWMLVSHYNLWKYISENNLDNVLILEDDAEPIKNFNKELKNLLASVPNDYDIVYLRCCGSCSNLGNVYYKLLFSEGNKNYNEKLTKPKYPLCTHAYLISNKGARKLLKYDEMKKVNYHIDHILAMYIYTKANFKLYASKTSLITQSTDISDSDLLTNEHPLLSYPLSFIDVSSNCTFDYLMNADIVYIRKLSVNISSIMLILFFNIIFDRCVWFKIYKNQLFIFFSWIIRSRNYHQTSVHL